MAIPPLAPKQDPLHTNLPIRGSASCPIFDHRKADAVAEEAPAPPASTKSRNSTPHHLKSNNRPNKPVLQVSDLPEIRYIRNIPKEMSATEIQSILKAKKFDIKDCWIEQTISQEEFKGNKKFVRIILPNAAAAHKFASNMKSLAGLKWTFSRVAPKARAQALSSNPTRKPNTQHQEARKPNLYTDRTTSCWTTETGKQPPKSTNGMGNQPARRPVQVPVDIAGHFLGLSLPPPHPLIQGALNPPTFRPPVPPLGPLPPLPSIQETWRNPPFQQPTPSTRPPPYPPYNTETPETSYVSVSSPSAHALPNPSTGPGPQSQYNADTTYVSASSPSTHALPNPPSYISTQPVTNSATTPTTNGLPYSEDKPSLTIGSWNVRGWGKGVNNELRKDILFALNLDILCVCETHLTGNENIIVDGYTWIGNNRKLIPNRARKGSGGVGILVKESLLSQYSISTLDDELDGILWVQFTGDSTRSDFAMCICYLPPSKLQQRRSICRVF